MLLILLALVQTREIDDLEKLVYDLTAQAQSSQVALKSQYKSAQQIYQGINNITDYYFADAFTGEVDRIHEMLNKQMYFIEKGMNDDKIFYRLKRFLDFYVRRSEVPETGLQVGVPTIVEHSGNLILMVRAIYQLTPILIGCLFILMFSVLISWNVKETVNNVQNS